jgi:hypothetical protein
MSKLPPVNSKNTSPVQVGSLRQSVRGSLANATSCLICASPCGKALCKECGILVLGHVFIEAFSQTFSCVAVTPPAVRSLSSGNGEQTAGRPIGLQLYSFSPNSSIQARSYDKEDT